MHFIYFSCFSCSFPSRPPAQSQTRMDRGDTRLVPDLGEGPQSPARGSLLTVGSPWTPFARASEALSRLRDFVVSEYRINSDAFPTWVDALVYFIFRGQLTCCMHLLIFVYWTSLAFSNKLFGCGVPSHISLDPFTNIFVRIFGSVFMRDIGLQCFSALFVWLLLSE